MKRTYPGRFGSAHGPKGRMRPATPLFYLHRLDLTRELFDVDMRLEGVGVYQQSSNAEKKPYMVISQEWVDAANESQPSPSEAEIAEFMTSLGFTLLEDSVFRWRRTRLGESAVLVSDSKPDNFIKTRTGVVPIDLIVGYEN